METERDAANFVRVSAGWGYHAHIPNENKNWNIKTSIALLFLLISLRRKKSIRWKVFYFLICYGRKRVLYYVWFTINNGTWLHVFHRCCHSRCFASAWWMNRARTSNIHSNKKYAHFFSSLCCFMSSLCFFPFRFLLSLQITQVHIGSK